MREGRQPRESPDEARALVIVPPAVICDRNSPLECFGLCQSSEIRRPLMQPRGRGAFVSTIIRKHIQKRMRGFRRSQHCPGFRKGTGKHAVLW